MSDDPVALADASDLPTAAPAVAEGLVPEAGAGGASSTADAPPRPSAPAWRLVDPPVLQSASPMPTTFDAQVERSLAAHIPVPQLAATARPMGHEVRRSAPVGVMGEVLRVVGSDAASIEPALLAASEDLVLRPLRAPMEDTEGAMVTSPASTSARPTPAPAAGASAVASTVARSTDPSAATDSPASLSAAAASAGSGPSDALPPLVPSAAPTRVLRAAAEADAPLVGSLLTSPAPRLATLVARAADPAPAAAAPPADADLPVVRAPADLAAPLRRRMAVEVRDPSVPVSLAAFEAPATASGAPKSVQRNADDTGSAASTADLAGFDSEEPTDEPPVQRAVAAPEDGATSRPTLGRGLGLGAPMQRLPDSAVPDLPEDDPFAGWGDEAAEPLSLAAPAAAAVSRAVDDGVAASASDGAGMSVVASAVSSEAPTAGADSSSASSPGSFELPASALAPVRPIVAQRAPLLPDAPDPIAALGGPVVGGPTVVPVAWPSAASVGGARREAGGPGGVGPVRRSADVAATVAAVRRAVADGAPAAASGAVVGTDPMATTARDAVPGTGPLAPVTRSVLGDAPSPAAPLEVWSGGSPSDGPWAADRSGAGLGAPAVGGAVPTMPLGARAAGSAGSAVPLRRLADVPGVSARSWSGPGAPTDSTSSWSSADTGGSSWSDDGAALPVAALSRAVASAGSDAGTVHRSVDPGLGGGWSTPTSVEATASWLGADAPLQRSVQVDEIETTVPAASSGDGGGVAAAGAPAAAAGGAAPQGDAELEQLAGRLYERIRHRLRRELLDDRERAGISIDRVR